MKSTMQIVELNVKRHLHTHNVFHYVYCQTSFDYIHFAEQTNLYKYCYIIIIIIIIIIKTPFKLLRIVAYEQISLKINDIPVYHAR